MKSTISVFILASAASLGVSLGTAEKFDYTPYHYKAEVVSVYDADTMTVEVDLGFDVSTTQRLRLYGINAWEVRGDEKPEGIIARDWFRQQVPIGSTIYLKTQKDKRGKYGRYLATVYKDLHSQALNDRLVELGHAKYQEY